MAFTDPYALLKVPRGATDIEIKKAYRRALLAYHPDKAARSTTSGSSNAASQASSAVFLPTIDDINLAYQRIKQMNIEGVNSTYSTVVNFNEIVDLDDLTQSELPDGSMQWTRPCRCKGDGYILFEQDLELNGDADEIAVQCAGCSIFILVQYAVE